LLSGYGVYEDGTMNQISSKDTSYSNTKQLDYYTKQGVSTSSYAAAIKQYNGIGGFVRLIFILQIAFLLQGIIKCLILVFHMDCMVFLQHLE